MILFVCLLSRLLLFFNFACFFVCQQLFSLQEGVTLHKGKPNQSLLSACEFMYRIREGRNDDDPKFHDHATFLTRYNKMHLKFKKHN